MNFNTLYGYTWGKLFRREVLDGVEDPEDISIGEDGVVSYRALSNAKNGVAFTHRPIYYYRIRSGSLSGHGQAFGKRDLDVFKQIKYVSSDTDMSKYSNDIRAFTFSLYYGAMKKYLLSDAETKKEYIKEYKIIKTFLQENWKNVMLFAKNPRIKILALSYRLCKHNYD